MPEFSWESVVRGGGLLGPCGLEGQVLDDWDLITCETLGE